MRKWLLGLGSAALSGAANVVLLGVAAPEQVAKIGWKIALGGAVIGVANYLKESPLSQVPVERKEKS